MYSGVCLSFVRFGLRNVSGLSFRGELKTGDVRLLLCCRYMIPRSLCVDEPGMIVEGVKVTVKCERPDLPSLETGRCRVHDMGR